MSYILGLDVGIASTAWGLLNSDQITDSGVRIFTAAETPKEGASLALPRREKRSVRRMIRRKAWRMKAIRALLYKYHLATDNDNAPYNGYYSEEISPWKLRAEALERVLFGRELSIILLHIAKRRGFQSTRKDKASDDNKTKGLLLAVKQNTDEFLLSGCRTIGEWIYNTPKFANQKRNKREEYTHSIKREHLKDEIAYIFKRQRELGSHIATEEVEKEYMDIAFHQRGTGSVEHMVGNCTFEQVEKRAPTQSYSFEQFRLWQSLNNLTISSYEFSRRNLTLEQKNIIANLAHTNSKVTYKQIRKKLDLSDDVRFSGVGNNDKEENKTFTELKGYHALKKAISDKCGDLKWQSMSSDSDKLNAIARILTFEKSDEDVEKALASEGFDDDVITAVKDISMQKVGHLSLKTINKILPYLKEGLRYDEATEKAGYNHYKPDSGKDKDNFLPPVDDLRNPVVNRALAQARKVINAVIREYGMPEAIHIELARDLSKSRDERNKIEKAQKAYRLEKELLKEWFEKETGYIPNDKELIKIRLWRDQDGRCPYSNSPIDLQSIFQHGYVDVDHILPLSRSWDDSMNNKVLCLASENRNKGNKTPYEYIGGNANRWQALEKFASHLKQAKRNRLLRKDFDEKAAEEFRERNLNDTRYIARYLRNYIIDNLNMGEDNKNRVKVRSGTATAFLRAQWGLAKVRAEGDLHHAVDAIVVAATSDAMVKRISDFSRRKELWELDRSGFKDHKERFPMPWEGFRNEVTESVSKIFVSRAPRRNITGAAHEETIRSMGKNKAYLKQGYTTIRTPLSKVNLNTLEKLHDKERNYRLYNILKERLEAFDNKPDKAFATPVYMPLKDGEPGPQVKNIKIMETTNAGIEVNGGIANNASMIRTDIFEKDKKFYLIPIYIADMVKENLPNRAIMAGKHESQWPVIDESYQFKFSLYPNDLVEVKKPDGEVIRGYYKGVHSRTAGITLEKHDRGNLLPDKNGKPTKNPWEGIGSKTLSYIKKFQVDCLGRVTEVKKEKRLELQNRRNKQKKSPQSETGATDMP